MDDPSICWPCPAYECIHGVEAVSPEEVTDEVEGVVVVDVGLRLNPSLFALGDVDAVGGGDS